MSSSIDRDIEAELSSYGPGLIAFDLKSVDAELTAFMEFAKSKLTPSSIRRLEELQGLLPRLAQAEKGKLCKWSTPLSRPIVTIPNRGAHQADRSGKGYNLQAEIHFTWEFVTLGHYSRKRLGRRIIVLNDSSVKVRVYDVGQLSDKEVAAADGKASTEDAGVKVPEAASEEGGSKAGDVVGDESKAQTNEFGTETSIAKECVAAWDFDVGDAKSPGCHFHTKYHEVVDWRRAIYDTIDVPRLPSVAFMLTDVIEFVVGELWQDESRQLMSNSDFAQWYKIARARMLRVFEWYASQLKGSMGSPWMSIKIAKPHPLLFLDPAHRP